MMLSEEGYKKFKESIKPPRKQGKVRNSYGVYDAYKHIRKKGWYNIGRPMKEGEFYAIVRSVNNLLAKEIAEGNPITFPSNMGKLEMRKMHRGVSLVNGKLKITYPVDWEETLRLWYEDEEARENKTLLRDETPYLYHIKYCKYSATYQNKCFYEFTMNRKIKIALKDNIKKGAIDTLWGGELR